MKAPLEPPEIYTWNSWVIVHRGKCVQVNITDIRPKWNKTLENIISKDQLLYDTANLFIANEHGEEVSVGTLKFA